MCKVTARREEHGVRVGKPVKSFITLGGRILVYIFLFHIEIVKIIPLKYFPWFSEGFFVCIKP